MVIDAVLNVATEMAVDRLVHNSVQFITKNQGYYCPWSFRTFSCQVLYVKMLIIFIV